ncbi:tyrosine-type recombinase/integrase [Bacillus sp. OTU2372]|uniref:tyrosine-type recombinase/integrase n=1 Tax=Bacillus sp. OTU2372 TaxID=3043858 RepID=UPI00313E70A8
MLEEYITYLQKKDKSLKTVISYRNDILIFLEDLHIRPDVFVTATDVKKWIHGLLHTQEGKPLAITSINRRLNALRSFYSWAVKYQKLQHNPMVEIKNVKSADEDSEKIMWLTEEEFEDLLNRVRKTPVKSRGVDPEEKYRRDRAIIYLLTYAGLRVDELSNLKLTDLDMELRRIRIIGKGRKLRTVPMSNILWQELYDWLLFRAEMANKKPHVEESSYVFYSQRSPQFTVRGIQAMIESYSPPKKKLTPHMFRHTFCKWMLKATHNDIEKVRRLAGHSNISTTAKYLRDSYSDLADAVEAMPKF